MKVFYFLKISLYRFFCTSAGRFLLKILSPFVYVKNLRRQDKKNKPEFLIAVTVDTESGYVEDSGCRIWQYQKPSAFIGFYKGIDNWKKLLDKHRIKGTFFLSTQCFDAQGAELKKTVSQLKSLDEEKHEIGLHLHPNSDFALQKYLKNNFRHVSAKFFDYNTILNMLSGSRDLVGRNLGEDVRGKITSFRWGNWGLDTTGAKALNDCGFKIDSSATPGIKGHLKDVMYHDWSRANQPYPWKLSLQDYQDVKERNSGVLEIPITTFNFFGFKLRVDPVYSQLLINSFEYCYRNADREKFIFVIMSHSPEGTYKDGRPTEVLRQMEYFIRHVKKYPDVRFVTLKDGATSLRPPQNNK